MAKGTKTREDRIREYAYYLWESEGRPGGRDVELWHRASEQIADDHASHVQAKRNQRPKATQVAPKARSRRISSSRSTPGGATPFAP
jgi:hypothetical protein